MAREASADVTAGLDEAVVVLAAVVRLVEVAFEEGEAGAAFSGAGSGSGADAAFSEAGSGAFSGAAAGGSGVTSTFGGSRGVEAETAAGSS